MATSVIKTKTKSLIGPACPFCHSTSLRHGFAIGTVECADCGALVYDDKDSLINAISGRKWIIKH